MNLSTSYCINAPQIVHEIFEDEVVIINLDNGNYYSLEKTGAVIWKLITAGLKAADVATAVAHHYQAAAAEVEPAVHNLLTELQQEALIVPVNSQPGEPANLTTLPNHHP